MTELLEQVIGQLKVLPDDQQDAIVARLLNEIKDEQMWGNRFEVTTDEQSDRMAELVRQEIAAGDIQLFPDDLLDQTES